MGNAEARKIPKADRLLAAACDAGLVARLGHAPVMEAVRAELEGVRAAVLAGSPCPSEPEIAARVVDRLTAAGKGSLRRVVNATGVVVHTNLGRAPLSEEALAAMVEVAAGYSNLEYDLDLGRRGDRYGHSTAALARLTGAEDAVVVNNNAAAVLLALAALCEHGPAARDVTSVPADRGPRPGGLEARPVGPPEVIVSRGQLVEIGGGFRIPDVLRRSGAALVEVGTTNRTYARDYEAALTERTRMLLTVHRSNFKLSGFVHDPGLEELVEIGRRHGVWVVDDLGSGTLLATRPHGLGDEPTVQERVAAGADLVTFSGDKLLGGPQAGILAGRREAIARVKRHPLVRALRVDKVTLAGLAATLAHYERGEALAKIPVWRAIACPLDELAARARSWRDALASEIPGASVRDGRSAIGGGSLPEVTLPTALLTVPADDADRFLAALRRADPPVVARVDEGRVALDPRTVGPGEDPALLDGVRSAWAATRR